MRNESVPEPVNVIPENWPVQWVINLDAANEKWAFYCCRIKISDRNWRKGRRMIVNSELDCAGKQRNDSTTIKLVLKRGLQFFFIGKRIAAKLPVAGWKFISPPKNSLRRAIIELFTTRSHALWMIHIRGSVKLPESLSLAQWTTRNSQLKRQQIVEINSMQWIAWHNLFDSSFC